MDDGHMMVEDLQNLSDFEERCPKVKQLLEKSQINRLTAQGPSAFDNFLSFGSSCSSISGQMSEPNLKLINVLKTY